ncbi:hypothetical protein CC86DRAFT_385323 [Ophiobolus disseminans]|uniref:Uncharacterized protein n=1 Tax=Ophiobolus disseminans TaxID=1469910 RepID=A0A6A6ZNU9_9PLEO|nr:hypothetical protein CC86DRAFT_385323 [Ophiobolus disseminans]
MQHHHEQFGANSDLSRGKNSLTRWDKVGSCFEFQLGTLQGLLQRSEANNARIQNEITLAFNAAAQRDSKVQLQIGEEAKREASAMKAIAVVMMTFLPATFVSVSIPVSTYWLLSVYVWLTRLVAQTIFGINFFLFEPSRDARQFSFAVSSQFWIY